MCRREDDPLVEDELCQPEDDAHRREADGDGREVEGMPGRCQAGNGARRQARQCHAADGGGPVQDHLTADAVREASFQIQYRLMRYEGMVPARLAITAESVAFATSFPYRMRSVNSLTPNATPDVAAYRVSLAI